MVFRQCLKRLEPKIASKIKNKDHSRQLEQENGAITVTNRKTLEVLMHVYFPGSTTSNKDTNGRQYSDGISELLRASLLLTCRLFTISAIILNLSQMICEVYQLIPLVLMSQYPFTYKNQTESSCPN